MAKKEGFGKYINAGAALGQVTKARAEEAVKEFVAASEGQREQAQQWFDETLERSKKASEGLLHAIKTEVSHQISALNLEPEQIAKRAADLLRQSAGSGKTATKRAAESAGATVEKTVDAAKRAASKASKAGRKGKKGKGGKSAPVSGVSAAPSTPKKAPAKKTAPKKSAVKKAAAPKKASAKKTAAKRAPAKKSAGARSTGTTRGSAN